MAVQTLPVPGLYGGSVSSLSDASPRAISRASNPASLIRILDPVKLVSGILTRAEITDTALYGFSAEPNTRVTIPQIAQLPIELNSAGNPAVAVYVGDQFSVFMGYLKSSVASAESYVGQTCDLAPYLLSPTPTLTTGGTAGATSYTYQVTALSLIGESKSLAATTITTGNAALSATNYNIVTIPAVTNAVGFNVYRGGVQIAYVPAVPGSSVVLNDTNLVGTGAAVGSTNFSGVCVDPTATSVNVVQIIKFDSRDPIGTLGARVYVMVTPAASQFLTA